MVDTDQNLKTDGQQVTSATAEVSRKKITSIGMKIAVIIIIAVIGAFIVTGRMAKERQANLVTMGARAKDIYVAIKGANTAREPLGLGSVWPKSGKKMEAAKDIAEMTFANSSDYFSALLDGEPSTSRKWDPYVKGFDYSKCAGAGVPVSTSEDGRLMAKNNAWTIAANITEKMPDLIPAIVSRNVDPTSLIPREGDLSQQFVRPSKAFTTPFGKQGLVLVYKDGRIFNLSNWKYANLQVIYHNRSGRELQAIREAFQTVEYLTP